MNPDFKYDPAPYDYRTEINNWIFYVQIEEAIQNTPNLKARTLLQKFQKTVFLNYVLRDDIGNPTMDEIYKAYTLMEAYWKDIPVAR